MFNEAVRREIRRRLMDYAMRQLHAKRLEYAVKRKELEGHPFVDFVAVDALISKLLTKYEADLGYEMELREGFALYSHASVAARRGPFLSEKDQADLIDDAFVGADFAFKSLSRRFREAAT